MTKTFIIAEIGINHNGDMSLVKKLIDGAKLAGVDAVKFQKRNIYRVYTNDELDTPRESPWGTTNKDQKLGLELGREEYDEIDRYCREKEILWSASAWDLDSVEFLKNYDLKFNKIASARLGHIELLEEVAKQRKHTYISTGMVSLEEIEKVVNIFRKWGCSFELMHCNSEYPLSHSNANLNIINCLKNKFECNVGYSCHTSDIITPCAAVAMGATSIEKHITLGRATYGSDQAASVEIVGFIKLVDYIRSIEAAKGNTIKTISQAENKCRTKLWRTEDVR